MHRYMLEQHFAVADVNDVEKKKKMILLNKCILFNIIFAFL